MTYLEAIDILDNHGSRSWAFIGWILDIKWNTLRKKALEVGSIVGRGEEICQI